MSGISTIVGLSNAKYDRFIGLVSRVFATGPGDLGSIPDRVIPKTFKMVLDTSLFNTQQYKYVSRVSWSNPGKGVVPSPKLQLLLK